MKSITEETRRKMPESAKRRCENPEWIASQIARGTQLDEAAVRHMYENGMTQAEIANNLHVSQKVVWRFMNRHGIKARKAAKRNQLRENNASWKGGQHIRQGYRMIYMPEHHKSNTAGYVREHDLIAEDKLGRPLRWYGPADEKSEVVHHIDGDKLNNSPDNLLVVSPKEHRQIHNAVCKEMMDAALLSRIDVLEKENKTLRERCNGKGTALWASEIEEFPMAVTKKRFGEG